MPSPFLLAANPIRTNGYSVLPLLPNSKRPAIEKWSDFCVKHADEETFNRWLKWKDCNIGVCLGVASNLVAIDLDNDIGGLHAKIEALLPPTPVAKAGAKGKTLFYSYNGQKSQGFSKDGERVLDILSVGRQTVLPPSVHPDTKQPYRWLTENTLENTPSMALPHIPIQTINNISMLFQKPEERTFNEPRHLVVYEDTTRQEVMDALGYIPSDDYDIWIHIGMCLKDKFGEAGFEMWNSWSATSTKYDAKHMRSKWQSFHNSGLTIATLYHYAMDNGYSCVPASYLDPVFDEITINGHGPKTQVAVAAQPKAEIVKENIPILDQPKQIERISFPPELLMAPGLPGKISDLINRTALMPQPVLALGASIAMAGTLMARKVRSETNLRTNFYIIGIAPSGAGKDHPRTIIKRMMHDTGIGNLELGVPASGAGIASALLKNGESRGLMVWDELGRTLKQYSSWRAGNHEREIMTALIELFSSAQSVYLGKSYANHDGKNPTKAIDQPCLSIYGTSVPLHFYEALSGSEAIDGFLSRWLIFESKDYTMEEEAPEKVFSEIPQYMIDICKYWKEQPFYAEKGGGNIADGTRVVPRVVYATSAANAYLKSFATEMRKKAMQAELEGKSSGAIWSRAGEHARRLALVAHEGDQIELKVAEWAVNLAKFCCNYMAMAIEDYVSSTELESITKRILRSIRDKSRSMSDPWTTRADLSRSFQGVQARVRNEILGSLIERGEIVEEKTVKTGGRPSLRYKAVFFN